MGERMESDVEYDFRIKRQKEIVERERAEFERLKNKFGK
jgi:hypothetical protein